MNNNFLNQVLLVEAEMKKINTGKRSATLIHYVLLLNKFVRINPLRTAYPNKIEAAWQVSNPKLQR